MYSTATHNTKQLLRQLTCFTQHFDKFSIIIAGSKRIVPDSGPYFQPEITKLKKKSQKNTGVGWGTDNALPPPSWLKGRKTLISFGVSLLLYLDSKDKTQC